MCSKVDYVLGCQYGWQSHTHSALERILVETQCIHFWESREVASFIITAFWGRDLFCCQKASQEHTHLFTQCFSERYWTFLPLYEVLNRKLSNKSIEYKSMFLGWIHRTTCFKKVYCSYYFYFYLGGHVEITTSFFQDLSISWKAIT